MSCRSCGLPTCMHQRHVDGQPRGCFFCRDEHTATSAYISRVGYVCAPCMVRCGYSFYEMKKGAPLNREFMDDVRTEAGL